MLSVVLAIPLAVLALVYRYRFVDRIIRVIPFVGFAMPAFWLALLLQVLLGGKLRWLPVAGYGDTFGEHLFHRLLAADLTR